MHLTKRTIEALAYRGPEPRKDIRWDELLPNFGVRLYPSGRKTFVIGYRHHGRHRLMTLGTFGVLTLELARDRARRELLAVADGEDPLNKRERVAQGGTVKDLAKAYLERYAKLHKKTWRDDEARLKSPILERWGAL